MPRPPRSYETRTLAPIRKLRESGWAISEQDLHDNFGKHLSLDFLQALVSFANALASSISRPEALEAVKQARDFRRNYTTSQLPRGVSRDRAWVPHDIKAAQEKLTTEVGSGKRRRVDAVSNKCKSPRVQHADDLCYYRGNHKTPRSHRTRSSASSASRFQHSDLSLRSSTRAQLLVRME